MRADRRGHRGHYRYVDAIALKHVSIKNLLNDGN
jgi:hypothetical protein